MDSLEDLLSDSLAIYIPAFLECGFDDVSFMVSMEREEVEAMLDRLELHCAQTGGLMKPAHRMMVAQRIRLEKVRRAEAASQRRATASSAVIDISNPLSVQSVMAQSAPYGLRAIPSDPALAQPQITAVTVAPATQTLPSSALHKQTLDISTSAEEADSTAAIVFWEGLGCCSLHWMFCFGVSMAALALSLFLLLLSSQLQHDIANSSDRDGGWFFAQIVMIGGFVLSGLACCSCLYSYTRNPDSAGCEPPPIMQDCLSAMPAVQCAVCGDCGGSGSLCDSCRSRFDCYCWEDLKFQVSQLCAPSASSFDCDCQSCLPAAGAAPLPDCSCPACACPSCSGACPSFSCSCGGVGCPPLPECSAPSCPAVSCDCCPNCNGVIDCMRTAYKILTCQCHIQV